MANSTLEEQKRTSMLDNLQRDALDGTKLKELSEKSAAVKRANELYIEELKTGTEKVLKGEQRGQEYKSKLEKSLGDCMTLQTTVADSVALITQEFSSVSEYLEGVEVFTKREKLANLVSRGKWGQKLKDQRVLNTSLSENLQSILTYYGNMRDVMYSSAVEVQKSVNAIKDVRDGTIHKLNENESSYNDWQQTRKTLESQLIAIENELVNLSGEQRTIKETERVKITDKLQESKSQEDDYFSIVSNAREDLKTQEQNLEQYENVVRGLSVSIRDMQEKVENRTVLFEQIEYLVKTAHRVRAAAYADQAMNKTTADISRTAVSVAEGILENLGSRKKAKPLSPEEYNELRDRGRQARAAWESIQDESKANYAQPGK